MLGKRHIKKSFLSILSLPTEGLNAFSTAAAVKHIPTLLPPADLIHSHCSEFQWSQREVFFLGHKMKQQQLRSIQASVIAAASLLRLAWVTVSHRYNLSRPNCKTPQTNLCWVLTTHIHWVSKVHDGLVWFYKCVRLLLLNRPYVVVNCMWERRSLRFQISESSSTS